MNHTAIDAGLFVLPELVLRRNVVLDDPPVYFTTNGEDPRLPGGDVNNAARLFIVPNLRIIHLTLQV